MAAAAAVDSVAETASAASGELELSALPQLSVLLLLLLFLLLRVGGPPLPTTQLP